DEDLPPIGEFLRERLAHLVQSAAVGVELVGDRVQPVVRPDIPAGAHARGTADGGVRAGADPDRRMRLLHRLGRTSRLVQLEMRALHRYRLFGPETLDRRQVLFEPPAPLPPRSAERLELDVAV